MANTAVASSGAGANGTQPTLASLKEEGSRAFAMKKYDEATAAWDRALALDSITPADAALLRNNKAACHMVAKRFKEAVAECTAALEIQPEYLKALVRRSKAYEGLGQYKQALNDLSTAAKLDSAAEDIKAAERRVKDLIAGKGPNLARKGATTVGSNTGAGRTVTVPVKLTFGDDTRTFQLNPTVTYSELLDHAKRLYPTAGHFALKYLDKEGDLVTISSRNDINRAIQEAVESVDRKRLAAGAALPAIRMHAVKVASAGDVPAAPEEEQKAMQQMLQHLQRMQQMNANKGPAGAQQAQQQVPQQQVIVDEWILAFVDLLKDHLGVDPDRPLELQEIGNEKLNAAFQGMMNSDPKAEELLDQAEEKFQEMVAMGMTCQAQVWEGKAQMLMQKAAVEGKGVEAVAETAEAYLKKAEAKADEALAYYPNLLDGYLMRNNVEQDRAKLSANYVVQPPPPREDITDAAERQAAEEAAGKAAILKAFERVTKEGVAAADGHMEKAYAHLREALEHLPEKERERELKPLKPMAEQVAGSPEDATPLKATMLINLGNAHYEHSILRAAADLDWRSLVLKAQELFREAGAAEVDIRQALKGHPKAEEMEDIIGPEPEPAAAATPATPAPAEEAPKGLPSLGARKKKESA